MFFFIRAVLFLSLINTTSNAETDPEYREPYSNDRARVSRLMPSETEPDTLGKIVSYVKSTLRQKTDDSIASMMQSHYETLRLFKNGAWVHPKLQAISEELLPTTITVGSCCDLVDQMGAIARRNPYLYAAVDKLDEVDLTDLKKKAAKDGDEVLPDVISYAMVLEKLTTKITEDINYLSVLDEIWDESKKSISVVKHLSLFEMAKYYGLLHLSGIKEVIRTGKVDPDYCRFCLPINILEAVGSDFCKGNFQNAYAGWVLATHRPGGKTNYRLQSGPAYVSSEVTGYPTLHFQCPLPRLWADLYTSWNLGFVSSYSNFPYFMAKLLIPRVNNYIGNPTGYMYHRVIALTTRHNFGI